MRIIQKTEDGSPTIYLPELDEHYHSVHGAIQESSHIFIQAGLRSLPTGHIRILEVGFGTGLNAFLTLLETFNNPNLSIEYFTVERYPLSTDITEQLDYPHLLAPDRADLFAALHRAPWDKPVNITPAFTLHKIEGDIATRLHAPQNRRRYSHSPTPRRHKPHLLRRLCPRKATGDVATAYLRPHRLPRLPAIRHRYLLRKGRCPQRVASRKLPDGKTSRAAGETAYTERN